MDWGFEQIFGAAVTILLTLAGAALLFLFGLVWKMAPEIRNPVPRLLVGARRAGWISGGLSAVILVCVGIVVVGIVMHSQSPPAAAPEGVKPTAPRSSPTATRISLAEAGWGPHRNLVKDANRPKTAMINSVVDHPVYGDERNFMRIRAADDKNATYGSSVIADAGKEYEVIVAIDNDAAEGGTAAKDVRLRLQMAAVSRVSAPSYAFITSSNVKPGEIYDGATLVGENTKEEFSLSYVADSAVLHTGGSVDGTVLPDDVFTKGTLVGCDALDGVLPAGPRCQSWVTFKVRVDQANFEVSAVAQLHGMHSWSETFVPYPGQTVRVVVSYTNTGTTEQDNVILKVKLPENMHLVTSSTTWSNAAATNVRASNDDIAGAGLNLGNYLPTANVFVQFEMVVDGPPGHDTNVQSMKEFFTAETDNGSKSASLTAVWF